MGWNMGRSKISVIGAGNVGATLAQFLAIREIGDVCLFDIVEGIPEGKALDIQEGSSHWGYDVMITGFSTVDPSAYKNLENSDVIVVTAGFARKPGMSRDDLLDANLKIIFDVSENIKKYSPDSIIVVVSNPADTLAYGLQKITGIAPERIIGLGGTLDSARFRIFVAQELGVSVNDVTAFVIGGHGDDMVPFLRYSNVAGIPLLDLIDKKRADEIIKRTRFGGGEIVNLLKFGGAYYAPAISIISMVEAILKDKRRVIPCAVYLSGDIASHYRADGIFIGVPIVLGRNGVERIFKIDFTAEEWKLWERTVASVKRNRQRVDELLFSRQ